MYRCVYMSIHFPTGNTYVVSNFQLLQTVLLFMVLQEFTSAEPLTKRATDAAIQPPTEPTKPDNRTASILTKGGSFF